MLYNKKITLAANPKTHICNNNSFKISHEIYIDYVGYVIMN